MHRHLAAHVRGAPATKNPNSPGGGGGAARGGPNDGDAGGGEGDISLLPPLLIVNRLGRRHVTNVGELEAFAAAKLGRRFVRRGATTFERASLGDAARALSTARVLVAPHGANMANMLLLPRGAVVVELLPWRCQRLRIYFEAVAKYLGLRYYAWQPSTSAMVVDPTRDDAWAFDQRSHDSAQCPTVPPDEMGAHKSFRVDPGEVLDVVEMALLDVAQAGGW